MRQSQHQPYVPEYEPREIAAPHLSKLAVVALVVSLLASPFVLRYTPYRAVTEIRRAAGVGSFILAVPAAISLLLTLVARRRVRRHETSLWGAPFVTAALVLNGLSLLFYVGGSVMLWRWHMD